MKPITAIIADDEPLARKRLELLLEGQPQVELLLSCQNGVRAVEAIETHRPDLVFLDVQMPDLDGFGVLKALDGKVLPEIIFVTAYDQYAIQAFDVAAVDYLLKPYDDERFEQALGLANLRIQQKQAGTQQSTLSRLLEHLEQPQIQRLPIHERQRVRFVDVASIHRITAEGVYVRLHRERETHLLRQSLKHLETSLGKQFLRVHRSTLVNLDFIKELHPRPHGEFDLLMKDGAVVRVSRSYRDQLVTRLGL